MNTISKIVVATAFSATVAGVLTGAALSGETRGISAAASCANAHWPMIPAECLNGAPHRDVRFATANLAIADPAMQKRFQVAFQ